MDAAAWPGLPGSWNGGAESPSVSGAVAALSCVIGAGSGPKAREHASRNVSLFGELGRLLVAGGAAGGAALPN
jgi:hypothetical protein